MTDLATIDRVPVPPTVSVSEPFLDDRKALIDSLDNMYPEYKHMFQRHDIDAYALGLRHQEVVHDKDGKIVSHAGGDIVVRVPRKIYQEEKDIRQERSRRSAERIFRSTDDLSRVASPKQPRINKDGQN